MEILGLVCCGLGLFFIGFRMISRNLRNLTGPRFKKMLHRATENRWLAALTGLFSGMVTQSGAASVFITTGFHTAGLLTFRQSMNVINWANIGTSVLLFILIFNFKLLIFIFTGMIGLGYLLQMDKTRRLQYLFQFLLGLSLLFLGVIFIKNGAQLMQSLSWFRDALHMSSGSIILLFLAGLLLTVAAQSGPTVSVVALTLTAVGLLNLLQAFIIVLGTGLGSAINILMLSVRIKGAGKQLSIYQGIFKTTGVVIMALLIFADYMMSPDHTLRLVTMISTNPARDVAWIFLFMQILPAILLTLFQKPVTVLLQVLSPPSPDDLSALPEFINNAVTGNSETALYLAEKEQIRLLRMLSDYLVHVSPDRKIKEVASPQVLRDCFHAVDHQLTHYLEKLLNNPGSESIQLKILQVRNFSSLLQDLEVNLEEFIATINTSFDAITSQPLAIHLIESLRTLLDTAIDNFENPDETGMNMILSMTTDKSDLLQKIRQEYFQRNALDDLTSRQSVFTLTLLYERICWLLRSMTVQNLKTVE